MQTMMNMMKAGHLVDYWCPATGARRVAVLAQVGTKVAHLVPLTAGKVGVVKVDLGQVVQVLPHKRTRVRTWATKLRRQGKLYGITKGASRALTKAVKATQERGS